jgi:hypothetical protein
LPKVVVKKKNSIFCNVTLCSPIEVHRRFSESKSKRMNKQAAIREALLVAYLLLVSFFVGIFFDTENRGITFLRIIRKFLLDYAILLFIVTVLRTSSSTCCESSRNYSASRHIQMSPPNVKWQ